MTGRWLRRRWLAVGALLFITTTAAEASLLRQTVGSGANQAHVVVAFGDGANFIFDVNFDGATTGLGLLDIIEADTTLTTVRQVFSFGTLVDGITFDGHSNIGFGGGDNFWHYWVREEEADPWGLSRRRPRHQ